MPASSWFMSLTRWSVSFSIIFRRCVRRLTKKPVAGDVSSSMASPMKVAHLIWNQSRTSAATRMAGAMNSWLKKG